MNILQELEDFIHRFNTLNDEDFSIDSLRIEFSKQHKLKKRLQKNEITSAWRLEKENIYYYNMQDAPKYRRAVLVIFGMKQYYKPTPSKDLITKLLQIMKDVSSIDVCLDLPYKPNLERLSKYFTLKPYITKEGVVTDTRYINETYTPMLDKIIFYNKAFKNGLQGTLWRIEATISIHNFKELALPLYEFKQITDIARRNLHD